MTMYRSYAETQPTWEGGNETQPTWEGGNETQPTWKGGNETQPTWEGGNETQPTWEGGKALKSLDVGQKATWPATTPKLPLNPMECFRCREEASGGPRGGQPH